MSLQFTANGHVRGNKIPNLAGLRTFSALHKHCMGISKAGRSLKLKVVV